jgi:hypothetical protein
MAEYQDREHFIPLRKQELIDLLCSDEGLRAEGADEFRQFCRLLSATYHFEYHQKLEALKNAYAPFDPDRDTRPLGKLGAEEKQRHLNKLFCDFAWLMERANFKHLCSHDLEPYQRTASDWGIRMDVDFSCFERLAIFARGDVEQKRTRRRLRNWYRLESTTVPVFQRLVIILKLRPHRRLSSKADTESVYLKIFKDIPKLDLNMLLPGARVMMSYLDRSKISFPVLTGVGALVSKPLAALAVVFPSLLQLAGSIGAGLDDALKNFANSGSPSWALWGLASGSLGYGYRSYYGYQQTRQRYRLTLTENLYFQNLDNNGGVLVRLLDEAEEQECREALLAYFFLWRRAGERGWTSAELDDAIEAYLEQRAGVKVDFEIGDAIRKLEELRIVEKLGDRYRARPLDRALQVLDAAWDSYFRYNNPDVGQAPLSA